MSCCDRLSYNLIHAFFFAESGSCRFHTPRNRSCTIGRGVLTRPYLDTGKHDNNQRSPKPPTHRSTSTLGKIKDHPLVRSPCPILVTINAAHGRNPLSVVVSAQLRPRPPSTASSCPVINRLAVAKNTTASATSPTVPFRPIGVFRDERVIRRVGRGSGHDHARCHAVHADRRRPRLRHRLAQHVQGGLACAVVRMRRPRVHATQRTDVHNASLAPCAQPRERRLRHQERPPRVGGEHRVPLRRRHVLQRCRLKRTGIVHQQIDSTQKLRRRRDALPHRIGFSHVACDRTRTDARPLQLRHGLLRAVRHVARGDDDICTFPGQGQRQPTANTSCPTGNNSALAVQPACHG